jgi:predicted small metal-binding protein
MDKMHETPNIPGTEPVTDNPNPGGSQGMDTTGPSTGPTVQSGPSQTGSRPSVEGGGNVVTFRCADVGIAGCRWEAAGRSEEELRSQIEQHGREAHGLKEIGESMWRTIRQKIRGRAA